MVFAIFWYLVPSLGFLSIHANTQIRHTLPDISDHQLYPTSYHQRISNRQNQQRQQRRQNYGGSNQARSFSSSQESTRSNLAAHNDVLRYFVASVSNRADASRQQQYGGGSNEARSFSSSRLSPEKQQEGHFEARALASGLKQEPFSQQVQQVSTYNKFNENSRSEFVKYYQPIKDSKEVVYNTELDILKIGSEKNKDKEFKENIPKVFVDKETKSTVITKDSTSKEVISDVSKKSSNEYNKSSSDKVIYKESSKESYDDFKNLVELAVSSEIIDRFDQDVIEDELKKEFNFDTAPNGAGRQYIPQGVPQGVSQGTHNIVYKDTNSSEDNTPLGSTPTRSYIVHDVFNSGSLANGQSTRPVIDTSTRVLNDGKSRLSVGSPIHHITSNTRKHQSGTPVHHITSNTRIPQSGNPIHHISGNPSSQKNIPSTSYLGNGKHWEHSPGNTGSTNFGGSFGTLTTKLVPPTSPQPGHLIAGTISSSIGKGQTASLAQEGSNTVHKRNKIYRHTIPNPSINSNTDTRGHSSSDLRTVHSNSDVRTVHSNSDVRTVHSNSDVRTVYSNSDLRTIHSTSDTRPVHSSSDVRTVHSTSDTRPLHSSSDVRPVHSTSDVRTVHSSSDVRPLHSTSDVRPVHSSSTQQQQHIRQSIPRVDSRPNSNIPYSSDRYQTTANLVDTQTVANKGIRIKNLLGDTSDILPSTAQILKAGEWHNVGDEQKNSKGVLAQGGQLLKVLNLNLWGLGWPLGEDKDLRVLALKEELSVGEYDIVMLQELWYRADYELLKSTMPYVTEYDSINSGCTSFILPLGCSGLTILSRHPIVDVRLIPFNERGSFWRFDGEIFVRKGLGAARILFNNLTIDVFTTHLVSYTKADDNKLVRYMQASETTNTIAKSDADIQIFGGDLNANPIDNLGQPYGMISSIMKDSLLQKYDGASFHPIFATFGNSENTYTRHYKPERIDYLMYRHRPSLSMETIEFNMPIMLTRSSDGRIISVSDHEPLASTFLIHDLRNLTQPRTFA